MAGVLINAASNVKKQFTLNQEVDLSNSVFKLFSKITVGICVSASILVASSEYLGKPITCQNSAGHVGGDVYEAYCWIHGGRKIQASEEMKEVWKCHANQHVSYELGIVHLLHKGVFGLFLTTHLPLSGIVRILLNYPFPLR